MIFTPLEIQGAFLIQLDRREDHRGFFARTFCVDEFAQRDIPIDFPQQSLARSCHAGTLRGMHIQLEPHGEDKFIRAVRGRIFDAFIDLRPTSTSFMKLVTYTLDADEGNALFVPRGCAHGYQTLLDDTDVLYSMTNRYAPAAARSIHFADPDMGIQWPMSDPIISDADRTAPPLRSFLEERIP